MAKTNGQPIRWGGSQPIRVTLVAKAPRGAQAALTAVTADLQWASRIPMRVTAPQPTLRATASTIAIYYSPKASSIGHLTLDFDDVLGVGGPSWSSNGTIETGAVITGGGAAAPPRDGAPMADASGLGRRPPHSAPQTAPTTAAGRQMRPHGRAVDPGVPKAGGKPV
jgi:hypothetical protein